MRVALQRAKKLWGDRHSLVSTAMNATDPATVVEHKLHIRQPSSLDRGHWGVGRVTLAGDAAHPMRPTNGEPVVHCILTTSMTFEVMMQQHSLQLTNCKVLQPHRQDP